MHPPIDINMKVPDRLVNCVAFIARDSSVPRFLGSAFIVALKGSLGNAYLHLVTAKHVADALHLGAYVLGMNGKSGKKIFVKCTPEHAKWWYHPTDPESVDVAVTLFGSEDIDQFDFEWIPEEMFATEKRIEEYSIGLGDEVVVSGLFTRFSGRTKNFPIVRSGNIAMMPTEPIPTKTGTMEAYLVEGRSIGGLSGSAVFVRNSVSLAPIKNSKGGYDIFSGLGHIHFLGLMHGHWDLPVGVLTEQAEAVNMGVSIVVPAKKILEVLYHPELVELRAKRDVELKKENLPSADVVMYHD